MRTNINLFLLKKKETPRMTSTICKPKSNIYKLIMKHPFGHVVVVAHIVVHLLIGIYEERIQA